MELRVELDHLRVQEAFAKAPARMTAAVEVALERGAQEITDAARRRAPGLFSTLKNSIRYMRMGEMHYQVVAGVHYARMVEEGTGPAAGKKKYYPNPDSLQQYLKLSPKMRRHAWAKKDSARRGEQELNIWFRSRALAWYIYQHGTKPQPFMQPALEEIENRLRAMAKGAAARAAEEVLGG